MTVRASLAALALMALSLPAAAAPAGSAGKPVLVPFNPNSAAVRAELKGVQTDTVDQFDPVARARALSTELPRRWRGTYVAYGVAGPTQTVDLELTSLDPVGQMLVLRGTLAIGTVSTPVQGNLNAKSDQLDLLVLGDASAAGLEPGGMFQGLQMFELSAWDADRTTNPGGKLMLNPLTQPKSR